MPAPLKRMISSYLSVNSGLTDAKGFYAIIEYNVKIGYENLRYLYREFFCFLHSSSNFFDSPTVWNGPFSAF